MGAAAQGCAGFQLREDDEKVLLELAGESLSPACGQDKKGSYLLEGKFKGTWELWSDYSERVIIIK